MINHVCKPVKTSVNFSLKLPFFHLHAAFSVISHLYKQVQYFELWNMSKLIINVQKDLPSLCDQSVVSPTQCVTPPWVGLFSPRILSFNLSTIYKCSETFSQRLEEWSKKSWWESHKKSKKFMFPYMTPFNPVNCVLYTMLDLLGDSNCYPAAIFIEQILD